MSQYKINYIAIDKANHPPYDETPWLFNLKSHNIIIGRTGTGKSNYLLHIIKHLNEVDCNTVLLDPHGQVSNEALKLSNKNKILLSGHDYPGSERVYSGINVLKTTGGQENAYLVADWIRHAFSENEALSQRTRGPRLNLNFSHILVSLMLREKGLTLKKFAEILSESKRTLSYFPVQEHSPIRTMTQSFSSVERYWNDFVMSSENKILPLISNPIVRQSYKFNQLVLKVVLGDCD